MYDVFAARKILPSERRLHATTVNRNSWTIARSSSYNRYLIAASVAFPQGTVPVADRPYWADQTDDSRAAEAGNPVHKVEQAPLVLSVSAAGNKAVVADSMVAVAVVAAGSRAAVVVVDSKVAVVAAVVGSRAAAVAATDYLCSTSNSILSPGFLV